MITLKISKADATNVFAEALGYNPQTYVVGNELYVLANAISALETPANIVMDDEASEQIVKGRRVSDWSAGTRVVGFAPQQDIEDETTNYQYWPTVKLDTGEVLFRGTLKVSLTEAYTPKLSTGANNDIIQLS